MTTKEQLTAQHQKDLVNDFPVFEIIPSLSDGTNIDRLSTMESLIDDNDLILQTGDEILTAFAAKSPKRFAYLQATYGEGLKNKLVLRDLYESQDDYHVFDSAYDALSWLFKNDSLWCEEYWSQPYNQELGATLRAYPDYTTDVQQRIQLVAKQIQKRASSTANTRDFPAPTTYLNESKRYLTDVLKRLKYRPENALNPVATPGIELPEYRKQIMIMSDQIKRARLSVKIALGALAIIDKMVDENNQNNL